MQKQKVAYLIGLIFTLVYLVYDFSSYQNQLRSEVSAVASKYTDGTILTIMERSGCFVFNNAHIQGADSYAFASPCTSYNYYLKGPGTIPLLILVVYGLFPMLYHLIVPLFDRMKTNLGSQVLYARSFRIVFSGIVGVLVLHFIYSAYLFLFSWGAPAAAEMTKFQSTIISIVCLTAVVFFIKINWGLHLQNVNRIVLLFFVTGLHLLPLIAYLVP